MCRLMIVDDDALARDVIQHSIHWNEIGIVSVETAIDGQDALQKCRQCTPDILITDVRMPNMDGLQLVQKLSELYPSVGTIILSGYGEFDYVRKAVQFGTSDYLLKPFSADELTASVERLLAGLYRRKDEWQKQASLSRETLVKELLEGRYRPLIDHPAAIHYFGKGWAAQAGWHVALIRLDDFHQFLQNRVSSERNLIEFCVSNIMNELLKNDSSITFCSFNAGEWALVIRNKDYKNILGTMQKVIKDHIKMTVSITVSKRLASVERIPWGLKEARDLQKYRFSLGPELIVEEADVRHLQKASSINRDVIEWVSSAVVSEDIRRLDSIFDDLSWELTSQANDISAIQDLAFEMVLAVQHKVAAKGFVPSSQEHAPLQLRKQMELFEVIHDLLGFMHRYLRNLIVEMKKSKIQFTNFYIAKCVEIVHKRYQQDLTLASVAAELSITPNYLSNLFKQELGTTFLDTLTEVRLDSAKQLLKQSTLKNYEISERVGYHSAEYFMKVFKKYTGTSPGDYRKTSL